jgi:uncharacterized protein (TIGR03435 family)
VLQAQPPASEASATTKFEVASIKPHPAGDSFGGTGVSPGMMNVRNLPVRRLIRNAYKVSDFQITGAPASFAATECYRCCERCSKTDFS